MSTAPTPETVAAAVATVDGVAHATADLGHAGQDGHLSVVFAAGVDRHAVARRVADLLGERFGLEVAPEAIARLAQDDAAAEPPASEPDEIAAVEAPVSDHASSIEGTSPAPPEPSFSIVGANGHLPVRPLARGLTLRSGGLEVSAEVVLSVGDVEVQGHATGADMHRARLNAVARATVDALEQLIEGQGKLDLEMLEVTDDGEDTRILVTLGFLTFAGADRLVGAAFVRGGDEEHATMRATLDAANRRVDLLLSAVN